MLEGALRYGEIACSKADDDDKEELEEQVAQLQEEYDNYTDSIAQIKLSLEVNIINEVTFKLKNVILNIAAFFFLSWV